MGKILKKLNVLLDKKQKWTMVGLLVMMLIGALLEVASIGIVVPVVSIVMDENAINDGGIVQTLYEMLPVNSVRQFTIVIMLSLIAAFIIKNIFLFIQQKFMLAFVYGNQFSTSERLMKNYLRKSYEFYLNADTAVVQRNITSDVNNMYALILALLQLLSEGIVFACLVAVLFWQDPVMTILVTVVLVLVLFIIKVVLKPIMHKAGEDNQNFYSGLFKLISQTVMGIKEVKITGKERIQWLDIAKGIAIILMIFGHINGINPYFRLFKRTLLLPFNGGTPSQPTQIFPSAVPLQSEIRQPVNTVRASSLRHGLSVCIVTQCLLVLFHSV